MTDTIAWVATAATVTAALLTASNLGARVTGTGFAVFTIGSIAWLGHGLATGQPALVWTNIVLTFLNLFGVWRWLGRQARVEQGGHSAAEASESAPGESLFPVSLLTRAPVIAGDKQMAACVDAMAGCSSGRIAYVVVSQGGVAGVGETLHRLPWGRCAIEEERLVTQIAAEDVAGLESISRDSWPAR